MRIIFAALAMLSLGGCVMVEPVGYRPHAAVYYQPYQYHAYYR